MILVTLIDDIYCVKIRKRKIVYHSRICRSFILFERKLLWSKMIIFEEITLDVSLFSRCPFKKRTEYLKKAII